MILGFLTPSSGKVFYDAGEYSNSVVGRLRKEVSVIQQNSHVFNGTVRENVDILQSNSDKDMLELGFKIGISYSFGEMEKFFRVE